MSRCLFLESVTAFSLQVTSRPPNDYLFLFLLSAGDQLISDCHHCRRDDSGRLPRSSSSLVDAPTPLTTDVNHPMIRYQEIVPINRQYTRESRAVNNSYFETVFSGEFASKCHDFTVQAWLYLHLFFINYFKTRLEESTRKKIYYNS